MAIFSAAVGLTLFTAVGLTQLIKEPMINKSTPPSLRLLTNEEFKGHRASVVGDTFNFAQHTERRPALCNQFLLNMIEQYAKPS